jgi:hypothetical protein
MKTLVIPAKTEIPTDSVKATTATWIPAFAGMTGRVGGMAEIA